MKKLFVTVSVAVGLLAGAATAHADGYLTPGEQDLGDAIGESLCDFIDANGVTTASMTRVFNIIYPQRVIANGGDVADVINYAVQNYCPQHWRELVSFGSAVRGT